MVDPQRVVWTLSAEGPFAQNLSGFSPRRPQQEMAATIAEVLQNQESLICEAGTGIGKTLAYLTPVCLSGEKTLISTGAKMLQEQLFYRDIPLVCKALNCSPGAALLKGRSNYLCLYRLRQVSECNTGVFFTREASNRLKKILVWAERTVSGDIAELTESPENDELHPLITSTTDNCLGGECPEFEQCFLLKARRKANSAGILVINHHLFFADMALREQGFGELLPGAQVIILDEAHQLAETAASFFGMHLSSRQCIDLCRDILRAAQLELEIEALRSVTNMLEWRLERIRNCLEVTPQRGAWNILARHKLFQAELSVLPGHFDALEEMLEDMTHDKALENCQRRVKTLQERLHLISVAPQEGYVRWFERTSRGFILHSTPIDVARQFQAYQQGERRSWIFTSATLSVEEDFSHFQQRLGVSGIQTRCWKSSFDFKEISLLYIPPKMPDPQDPHYIQAVTDVALSVLPLSQGRAFLLFTSYRALHEAARLLRDAQLAYPMLVQGESPRSELLRRFRQLGDAVLLGVGSFWEGVDVRGEALSCVLIDKLPFASPGDPVMEARIHYLREQGQQPFNNYQLPQAVIALKQGAGRLIRDANDRGVLVICDPRLYSKRYGSTFLASLPPFPMTRQLSAVKQFFQEN